MSLTVADVPLPVLDHFIPACNCTIQVAASLYCIVALLSILVSLVDGEELELLKNCRRAMS